MDISRRAFFLLMGCAIGAMVIPSWAETLRIEITRLRLDLGLKLAFLVDTHLHSIGPVEENVLKIISKEDPDVIVHGGDIIDEFTGNLDLAKRYFSSLDARGKYTVLGNHDYWSGKAPELVEIMRRECGFHTLMDEVVEFSGLRVFGVDWRDDRHYLRISGADVVLAHDPNVALRVDSARLILTGHTHGGIVVGGVTIFSNSIYSRGVVSSSESRNALRISRAWTNSSIQTHLAPRTRDHRVIENIFIERP